MESIILGIYLWFKIYFLIDTNAKMWTEITDLVFFRKKLLKFLQGENGLHRFLILFLRNQKLKKEKWRCCQNLDLNPVYVEAKMFPSTSNYSLRQMNTPAGLMCWAHKKPLIFLAKLKAITLCVFLQTMNKPWVFLFHINVMTLYQVIEKRSKQFEFFTEGRKICMYANTD